MIVVTAVTWLVASMEHVTFSMVIRSSHFVNVKMDLLVNFAKIICMQLLLQFLQSLQSIVRRDPHPPLFVVTIIVPMATVASISVSVIHSGWG